MCSLCQDACSFHACLFSYLFYPSVKMRVACTHASFHIFSCNLEGLTWEGGKRSCGFDSIRCLLLDSDLLCILSMLANEVAPGGKGHALSYVAQCGMHSWLSWAQGLFALFFRRMGKFFLIAGLLVAVQAATTRFSEGKNRPVTKARCFSRSFSAKLCRLVETTDLSFCGEEANYPNISY